MRASTAAVFSITGLFSIGSVHAASSDDWFDKLSPARLKSFCRSFSDFPRCKNLAFVGPNDPAPPPRTEIKLKSEQRLFLFRDRTDVFAFTHPNFADATLTPGASISFSDDMRAKAQNLTVQGIAGYSFPNSGSFTLPGASEPSAIGISPNVYVYGTLTEPRKATEVNALRASLDVQTAVDSGSFSHAFDVGPYFQTDFRGSARIGGVSAQYEPLNGALHLGETNDLSPTNPQLIAYFLRVLPEIDYNHVDNAGLTRLRSDTDNAFLGGTLQLRSILLPNNDVLGTTLCGRIYVNGTAQYFNNVLTHHSLSNYIGEVGFYLNDGVSKFNNGCYPRDDKGRYPLSTDAATSSAVSFVYTDGTDKTTLLKQHQYRVQLNFRY